jgi:MFS family permease
VVCSRTAELQALRARLRLEEAVELQPPSDAQVEDYLDRLEATGTPLADVRAALRTDPTLRELLRSPLLLHVVAIAYHGEPAPALQASGTLAQRQAGLWQAYVARMFRQRPLDPGCGYTSQQALAWLAWLARALRDRDQSEFQLDRLTPDWLPTQARQQRLRRLSGLAVGLVISLLLVLAARALLAWSDPDSTNRTWADIEADLAREDFVMTLAIPAVGLALVLGSLGLAGRMTGGITPAEELHWSWSGLGRRLPRRVAWGLAWGLVLGLLLGLVYGLAFVLPNSSAGSYLDLPGGIEVRGFAMVPAMALAMGVVFGLLFGIAFGLTAGLTAELRDERTLPNEGIRRSARHALIVGLAVALIIGLAVANIPPGRLADALGVGLIVGLAVGLVFGGAACLQHYRVRASLVRARVAPWRYGRFLEAMTQRLLLRRSGSAYLFVHRLFRDYLADLTPDQPPAVRAAASH